MQSADYFYDHGAEKLKGYLATKTTKLSPAVLVVHDWSGRNEFACQQAAMLAKLGYVGFAVDMFGQGRVGETTEEKQALIQPFIEDRAFLRARLMSALNVVRSLEYVDNQRIAIIGFCFGGLCALDIARTGEAIKGVVSFHGILNRPEAIPTASIKAKILVLHGYDDPMVTPNAVNAFCEEMTTANADWQVDMYGHTQHAFTNPNAHDAKLGTIFNACANKRAFQSMTNFLAEIFGE